MPLLKPLPSPRKEGDKTVWAYISVTERGGFGDNLMASVLIGLCKPVIKKLQRKERVRLYLTFLEALTFIDLRTVPLHS